ncbi:type IV pilus twitching motility protein PilT [Thiocystis violascens]|uniref:Pilus retraction protein PilT n=1 Tax=Thiocystis violascens (strain ATCC 17096 / DSM 198 / 6111) TaxID=765911 RepID=I3Y5I9_THIV6|nr:PilT/PilU family type 4a pilus ATPase [Thiocystis violascens]AFL72257.1 pilus retraction protein PilT [Thiocystis violascens DSM 198]
MSVTALEPVGLNLDALLAAGVSLGASDLHLTVGSRPSYRILGELAPAPPELGEALVGHDAMERLAARLATERQREDLAQTGHLDLGYGAPDGERFRLNLFREQGHLALAARHLDQGLLSLDRLGLPPQLEEVGRLNAGLVLVTGATGSGKSTTLATLLDRINETRAAHILTVEDPVEFVHRPKRCVVHHRELGRDVASFAAAVQASLREDPDVIMIGEMRDLDTMRAAITAAETGHLVFSTLHTAEAVGCVERLVGSFPGGEQDVARHRIGMSLKAVIAQRLLRRSSGRGRVAAVEILMVNPAAANLIEQGKTRQLFSLIESSAAEGMRTMDQSLAELVHRGILSRAEALVHCKDAQTLERQIERAARLVEQAALAEQTAAKRGGLLPRPRRQP